MLFFIPQITSKVDFYEGMSLGSRITESDRSVGINSSVVVGVS